MQTAPSAEIQIPVERIERELMKSARPGFYGQCEIEIVLEERVLEGVSFRVRHSTKLRAGGAEGEQVNAAVGAGDTEREGAVRRRCKDLKRRLQLRAETVRIVGHFSDGRLESCEIQNESAG